MKKALCVMLAFVLLTTLVGCTVEIKTPEAPSKPTSASSTPSSSVPSSSAPSSSAPPSSVPSSDDEPSRDPASSETDSSEIASSDSGLKNPDNPNRPSTPPLGQPETDEGMNDPVTVTQTPRKECGAKTFTGLPALPTVSYLVNDPNNAAGLSTKANGFSYGAAKSTQKQFDSAKKNLLAVDTKTAEKVLYLTFDCGYPYKDCADRILDTLKEKNVPAAFFCTLQFLREAPTTTARMINEGHIVGNHTANHPDSPTIKRERFAKELLAVDNYLRVNYGYENKYFRYPSGSWSNSTADVAFQLGYRTAFWSVAYVDWDPDNQMEPSKALPKVTSQLHPGAVILLHTTSPTNVKILADFIDEALRQGYTFRSLDEYEYWDK